MEWMLILIALFALKNIGALIVMAVVFVVALVFFTIGELIGNEKSNNDDGKSQ